MSWEALLDRHFVWLCEDWAIIECFLEHPLTAGNAVAVPLFQPALPGTEVQIAQRPVKSFFYNYAESQVFAPVDASAAQFHASAKWELKQMNQRCWNRTCVWKGALSGTRNHQIGLGRTMLLPGNAGSPVRLATNSSVVVCIGRGWSYEYGENECQMLNTPEFTAAYHDVVRPVDSRPSKEQQSDHQRGVEF